MHTVNNLDRGGEPENEDYDHKIKMSVVLKYVPWNRLVCIEPRFLKLIPDEKAPWLLCDVPVHFRAWGMCIRAVEKCLHPLRFIPDHLKTQEMCEKAVEKNPYQLGDFPDRFKTKRMCEKAVEDKPEALE